MLVSRDDDDTVRARLRMRLILPRDKPLSRFFPFFCLAAAQNSQTNKQTNRERECVSALCATSGIVVYHPFLYIIILLNTLNTKTKARATNHLWRKTEAAERDFLD